MLNEEHFDVLRQVVNLCRARCAFPRTVFLPVLWTFQRIYKKDLIIIIIRLTF